MTFQVASLENDHHMQLICNLMGLVGRAESEVSSIYNIDYTFECSSHLYVLHYIYSTYKV